MPVTINSRRSLIKQVSKFAVGLIVIACTACGGSLDSLEGPKSGKVSGLVCNDLQLLLAAAEPAVQYALIEQGKCIKIRSYAAKQVDIVRTVMMPGDQKYSQFELKEGAGQQKMWIPTARIKQTGKRKK
ncbi:MAG: hypothetical protein CMQ20_14415 [Gammaproteobacteria bacterium]|nr:hypothetical protein [Gammaproteobacteria bacterium]